MEECVSYKPVCHGWATVCLKSIHNPLNLFRTFSTFLRIKTEKCVVLMYLAHFTLIPRYKIHLNAFRSHLIRE